ncbi:SCAN box domain-containing protein [Trichonephila clavipes]|uniref:SCAN box domain-containing protein n=1 Tax=Trichonephila clavipes TaxID=2585209 RepID=A0A8X7BEG8_TRICX|nr:SCAN box domain-containing protein [Trichonephila clavipes]
MRVTGVSFRLLVLGTVLNSSIPYSANSHWISTTCAAILRYNKRQSRYATIRPLSKSETCCVLPRDIINIITRESEELASDYDHVKALLLKRFKLSPEKFRQLFVKHQKNPETTWDDFYYELQTYFEGWIAGLGITIFKQLKDLMITDQLKEKAPIEFKEHHLDEWSGIISPVDLTRKIEEYEDARKTFQKKVTWSYFKDTMKKKWNNSMIIPRENVSMNNPMNTKNRNNHQDFEKRRQPPVF